jgi:hypothetical protein
VSALSVHLIFRQDSLSSHEILRLQVYGFITDRCLGLLPTSRSRHWLVSEDLLGHAASRIDPLPSYPKVAGRFA